MKRFFWTKENSIADALKYKTKSEWINGSYGAYLAAQRNGWLNDCCSHMFSGRKAYKWTLESCKKEALKYITKTEWAKKSSGSYDTAWSNNWIDLCSTHMNILWKKKWTLELCKEDALKYTTKIEWSKKSRKAYDAAHSHKWINECCKHMIPLGSSHKRLIYVFEFSDKSAYIGLTFNSNQRKKEHIDLKLKKRTAVGKYIEKTGLQPKFIELTEYLDKDNAVILEDKHIQEYRNNGWNILNIRPAGNLGNYMKNKYYEHEQK